MGTDVLHTAVTSDPRGFDLLLVLPSYSQLILSDGNQPARLALVCCRR